MIPKAYIQLFKGYYRRCTNSNIYVGSNCMRERLCTMNFLRLTNES